MCSVTTDWELVSDHAGIFLSWIFTSASQGAIYKFIFICGESVCEMVARITKNPTCPMASWTFRTILVISESPFHILQSRTFKERSHSSQQHTIITLRNVTHMLGLAKLTLGIVRTSSRFSNINKYLWSTSMSHTGKRRGQ